jgi:hypothetical protein
MEPDFFKVITDQTGILLLAVMMIWIMKGWHEETVKRNNARTEEIKREHELAISKVHYLADERKADLLLFADIVRANTDSNIRLIAAVESMKQMMTSEIKVTRS